MIDSNELIESLERLDFNDLTKVINNALEARNERRFDPETGLPDDNIFLLTEVVYDEGKVFTKVCAIGTSLELTPELPGHSGRCKGCDSILTSSCKIATCPVCRSTKQELT